MRRHPTRPTTLALALVATAGLLSAACGGDDSAEPASTTAPSSSPGTAGGTSTSALSAPTAVRVDYAFGEPGYEWAVDPIDGAGLLVHGSTRYTGDWETTSTYAYARQTQGDRFAALSLGVLDGSMQGCGRGRFLLVVASLQEDHPEGGWSVVPGFGDGDLTGMSGQGTWRTTEGDLNTPVSKGVIEGEVTCSGEGGPAQDPWFYGTPGGGPLAVDATDRSEAPTQAWTEEIGVAGVPSSTPVGLSDGYVTQHLTGTWSGEAETTFASAARPGTGGGFVEAAVMKFSGTVQGCGTGSLVVVSLARVDDQGAAGERSWEIAPGLGTGDLAGASGFGGGTGSIAGGTGTLTGSMTCHA